MRECADTVGTSSRVASRRLHPACTSPTFRWVLLGRRSVSKPRRNASRAPPSRGAGSLDHRHSVPRAGGSSDDAELVGGGDGLRLTMDAELREYSLDVACHGLGADDQLRRDLSLRVALGQPPEHLELAFRQIEPAGRRRWSGRLSPRANDGSPHAREELVRIHRLDEVVVAADEQADGSVGGLDPLPGNENDRQVITQFVSKSTTDLESVDVG